MNIGNKNLTRKYISTFCSENVASYLKLFHVCDSYMYGSEVIQ